MSDKIKLRVKDYKVNVFRKNDNKGKLKKMKINFELDKEESESFATFAGIRPPDMSLEDFCKMIFFVGALNIRNSLEEGMQIQNAAKEILDPSRNQAQEIQSSSI